MPVKKAFCLRPLLVFVACVGVLATSPPVVAATGDTVPVAGTTLKIPANVQASAAVGLVVRVKEVVVADDVTLVTISASYSGSSQAVQLAWNHTPTYIEDADGQRYPIRRPEENPTLTVKNNDTMQGRLVFLGRIAAESKSFKLVFNDGSEGDSWINPTLTLTVPLS